MLQIRLSPIIAVFLLLIAGNVGGQTYRFKHFTVDNGLNHNGVYDIAHDRFGFVWFATGLGVCRYDGFDFYSPETLPKTNASTLFEDKRHNLWIGYNNGNAMIYDGQQFILADSSANKSSVSRIVDTPKGNILIIRQNDSITHIADGEISRFRSGMEDKYLYSVCFCNNRRLLLGCHDGAYLCHFEETPFSIQLDLKIAPVGDAPVTSIVAEKGTGNYWLTAGNGLFHIILAGENINVHRVDVPEWGEASLQSVAEGRNHGLWVATMDSGLYRLRVDAAFAVSDVEHYGSNSGLGSNYIKQVVEDDCNNLWIATYDNGVASLNTRAYSYWDDLTTIGNNALSLAADTDTYWLGGRGAILKLAANGKREVLNTANGLPHDNITALHSTADGVLWIGSSQNGIYRLDNRANRANNIYRSGNSTENNIQDICSTGDYVVAATLNGVLVIDKKSNAVRVFNTNQGLPRNNIRSLCCDRQGNIWAATNSNKVFTVNWLFDPSQNEMADTTELEIESLFTSITADEEGRIWAGTGGSGVFMFDHDTVIILTTHNGLHSDYCYAMQADNNGHVWVGHQQGLSRIDTKKMTIITVGKDYGITGDVNPNALCLTPSGDLLVGMNNGMMRYRPSQEEATVLPLLNAMSIEVGDSIYSPQELLLLPFDRYRIRFNFIGLQYEHPEAVTYRYMLAGYDNEWSQPTAERSIAYQRLESGEYSFIVQACINNQCTEPVTLFDFKILQPFWRRWWFILVSSILFVFVLYSFIRYRERSHRRAQEYLERELAERTREVLQQKEEIEAKNKDITDSINYAQRIQFSVLPSTRTLSDCCSGAFIFYRPRDIVSGDFYWFDYFPDKDSLLVVCADSTGHGVPGAFMSLIGTTLIKDIAIRPNVKTPADILQRLDVSIQSTLNQNQESETANDGMDIIVIDINLNTGHTRMAAANRPIVVYHNGQQQIYRGDHVSVGDRQIEHKTFTLFETDLLKGDTIYMFSDGYSDQFGGPTGKKFKVRRLFSVLDDIQGRNMDEQCRVLTENFDLWKGPAEQVDDVLLIGLQI